MKDISNNCMYVVICKFIFFYRILKWSQMFKSLSTHISFISEYARFTNLRAMSTVFALSSGK